MSIVRRNIVANFGGSIWNALMSLAFVPLYVYFLGIEAYGLVGVSAMLHAMTALLDMGLSSTLNREMARLSIEPSPAQRMRDLLRTLEAVFWAGALVIALLLVVLAPWLASGWLRAEQLSPDTTAQAVLLMGLALALQWPFGLYAGGLLGLQRQVLFNGIVVGATTFRGVGSVLVLWLVSPTIFAFFLWQIIASALQTALAAGFLWHSLPRAPEAARFRSYIVRDIWRFAAGLSGITVLSVILTQLDKIVLSRLLTLEMFGYYTLAAMAAMSLYRLISPLFSALYPRYTELVARGDEATLRRLYHQSCQLMSVVVLPPAFTIAAFSPQVLAIWTQNPSVVEHASLVMALLFVGTALNGLMNLPYALQLAHGWTRIGLYGNAIAVVVLVPLLVVAANRFGAPGAAAMWVLLNAGYVLITVQVMHTRLLRGEMGYWYAVDVGMPLVAGVAVVGLGRWLLPGELSMVATFLWVVGVGVVALVACALTAPAVRRALVGFVRQRTGGSASVATGSAGLLGVSDGQRTGG